MPGEHLPGNHTAPGDVVGAAGVNRILRAEQARGQAGGRPAVKFAGVEDLVRASRLR